MYELGGNLKLYAKIFFGFYLNCLLFAHLSFSAELRASWLVSQNGGASIKFNDHFVCSSIVHNLCEWI
jgi:hypothetical protein